VLLEVPSHSEPIDKVVPVKYSVILADPPWQYKQPVARIRKHYTLMDTADICALPVAEMAAKDCALFLWATFPQLPQALDVMKDWGFEYQGEAFTWIKLNRDGSPFMGCGSVTRKNSEVCLLGSRGKVRAKAHNISSVLMTTRREHSRKPDEQYDRIMRLFDGPYLELFARQRWPGWDVWGNQSGKFPAQPFLLGEFAA
jgi:N6-adenosine-specific RNA methylase IME4